MDPTKELCDEMSCPVCLDYFKDPVILDCGHNFCRACLLHCWRNSGSIAPCPECREMVQNKNLRPNRQLANVVELVKHLGSGQGTKRKRGVCEMHQEPLKLFCKDDQIPICVVCDRSKEHRGHKVVPEEEAAQECKEKIQVQLQPLKKERENLMDRKLAEEMRSRECLIQVGAEKQKISSAFEQMQKLLEEKNLLWLDQLGAVEKEIEKRREENVSAVLEEISSLDNLITEMERKCQQPASELLQDIRSTLNRDLKGQQGHLLDLSPGLEEGLRSYSQKRSVVTKAMEKFGESLNEALSKETLKQCLTKANVSLDPDTANSKLILSKDLKSVIWGARHQDLPDNPERFDTMLYVLGRESFTSGRHWWEVTVEVEDKEARWAVGVARETVRRKGKVQLRPNEGIWAVGKALDDTVSPRYISAFTSPKLTSLASRRKPRTIRVSLDYEAGLVAFFDADKNDWIFTFPPVSFSGERLRPFFRGRLGVTMKC